ncbi:MAG: hypothetical protein GY816_17870 [Cytophagales bacterium]|nr:hypothetical protein [Cytophagales bacterium]
MQKRNWLLLFSILMMFSCTKESETLPLGQDYFPIAIGDYRMYDVTETTYVDKVETIETYQLRESFYDLIESGNETTFLMRIERRETDQDNWLSVENIAILQTASNLEYKEQNMTFVKMSFPVIVNRVWDGNAQNQDFEQLYHYEELGSSDYTFENSDHIKVIISDLPANIVAQDERFETYAQDVGLVERNFIEIGFCTVNCDGEVNIPEDGRILIQRLIEYGSE